MSWRKIGHAEIKLDGVDELIKAFEMSPRQAFNLTRAANYYVAAKTRDRMRQYAPKNTGLLKKSIRARKGKAVYRGRIRSYVDIKTGTRQEFRQNAWYWYYPDRGTRLGNPSRPGMDFSGRASREIERQAPKIFHEKVAQGVAKFIAKKAKT